MELQQNVVEANCVKSGRVRNNKQPLIFMRKEAFLFTAYRGFTTVYATACRLPVACKQDVLKCSLASFAAKHRCNVTTRSPNSVVKNTYN